MSTRVLGCLKDRVCVVRIKTSIFAYYRTNIFKDTLAEQPNLYDKTSNSTTQSTKTRTKYKNNTHVPADNQIINNNLKKSRGNKNINSINGNNMKKAHKVASNSDQLFTFKDYHQIPAHLQNALAKHSIHTPTPIQHKILQSILSTESGQQQHSSLLICAQTGSGKSFALLLALLCKQRLKTSIMQNANLGTQPSSSLKWKPSFIVLVPSALLARQYLQWAQWLAFDSDCSIGIQVSNADTKSTLSKYPQITIPRSVHILLTTPSSLIACIGEGRVRLDGLEALVVDEVDAQLQSLSTYAPKKLERARQRHPPPLLSCFMQIRARKIVCSASIKYSVRNELASLLSDDMLVLRESNQIPDKIVHLSSCVQTVEQLSSQIAQIIDCENAGNTEAADGLIVIPAGESKQQLVQVLSQYTHHPIHLLTPNHPHTVRPPSDNHKEEDPPTGKISVASDVDVRGLDCPTLGWIVCIGVWPAHEYLHIAGRLCRLSSHFGGNRVYSMVRGETEYRRLLSTYSQLKIKNTSLLDVVHIE